MGLQITGIHPSEVALGVHNLALESGLSKDSIVAEGVLGEDRRLGLRLVRARHNLDHPLITPIEIGTPLSLLFWEALPSLRGYE